MTRSALALFLIGILYLLFFAMFTFEVPAAKVRGVKGFLCLTELPKAALSECPLVGTERLKDAGYNPELIWQSWTVSINQFGLSLIWISFFISLSTVIGAFLVFQTKQPAFHSSARSLGSS
jgi:hypothetical protein